MRSVGEVAACFSKRIQHSKGGIGGNVRAKGACTQADHRWFEICAGKGGEEHKTLMNSRNGSGRSCSPEQHRVERGSCINCRWTLSFYVTFTRTYDGLLCALNATVK